MISSRLLEADLLYQMGAAEIAAERLEPLARETTPESARLAALCRLIEIACDDGHLDAARRNLAEMHRSAEQLGGELALGRSRRAHVRDGPLRILAARRRGAAPVWRTKLRLPARQAAANVRAASLAIRINSYLAVDRYHRQDLAGAGEAAATASHRRCAARRALFRTSRRTR